MELTSEVFVMILFVLGIPFFYVILKDSRLPYYRLFLLAYLLFAVSNIFTVLENCWLNEMFNLFEHLLITCGALVTFGTVVLLTSNKKMPPHSENRGKAQK